MWSWYLFVRELLMYWTPYTACPLTCSFILPWISLTDLKTISDSNRSHAHWKFSIISVLGFVPASVISTFLDLFGSKSKHSNLRGSDALLSRNLNNPLLVPRPQVPVYLPCFLSYVLRILFQLFLLFLLLLLDASPKENSFSIHVYHHIENSSFSIQRY